MTVLDQAHAAMETNPESDTTRLRFYQAVAEVELFLVLEAEASDGKAEPRLFELESGPTVAVFDSEDRLAEFAGDTCAYLALPGRRLVEMLAGQGLALGLNLGVAPSAFLMPPDAVEWLAGTAGAAPTTDTADIREITRPGKLPETLIGAIDRKLSLAAGLADWAGLAGVIYGDGRSSHVLAFVGATPGAEAALSSGLNEALIFSGIDLGELDIVFVPADSPLVGPLERLALRFDLPEPPKEAERIGVVAPGMDPEKPPRLK